LSAGLDVPEGSVGAGTGCTVGKRLGLAGAMRGGQGTAAIRVTTGETGTVGEMGCTVAALVVVNAVGDVVDPETGAIVAGARHADGSFAGGAAWRHLASLPSSPAVGPAPAGATRPPRNPVDGPVDGPAALNTTIGVVATDAPLTKAQAQRVAWMAHDGLARAVRPAHTLSDGDTLFVLATGKATDLASPLSPLLVSAVGAAAADVVATAIVRAVRAATSLPGIPAAS
jgi:L-aminopeptidase/D-esterase-like protein